MHLHDLLNKRAPSMDDLPPFIRAVDERRGVRVVRLQGDIGKSIGAQVTQRFAAADASGISVIPVLFDFRGTTGADFATIAYLVDALRRRLPARASIGIVNAPDHLLAEIEISRLSDVLRVYASEDEGVASLAPAAGGGSA